MIRAYRSHVEVDRIMKATAPRLWDLLVDTTRWKEWGPSVRAVDCPDRWIRLGSLGRVRTTLGFWVPFLVTEFDEGRYWAWRVSGIAATGHRLDILNHDLCRLTFEVPLWAFPYASVCMLALNRIARIVEPS
ncbi:MAG: hypothetical protein HGA63_10160 [Syntrophobacteraceae bacterium]|nr:hypothetical protein [Syntrophobacteraceae bacterium]